MPDVIMPTETEVRDAEVEYLLDVRDSLCRQLRATERRLERLGHPVSKPKVKPGKVGILPVAASCPKSCPEK